MALIAIVVDCLLLSFLLTIAIFDCFVVVIQSFDVWYLSECFGVPGWCVVASLNDPSG